MLGTLRGLPKEEEAVDDDESEAGGLQYDEGEEAALGRAPPRTTSASTFRENYVMQVESDSYSKELKKVSKTNIVLIIETPKRLGYLLALHVL